MLEHLEHSSFSEDCIIFSLLSASGVFSIVLLFFLMERDICAELGEFLYVIMSLSIMYI